MYPICGEVWRNFAARYYPVVYSESELALVPKKLNKNKEFVVCPTFKPDFIDQVIYHGYFPMSISGFKKNEYLMAIKCHVKRCYVRLNQDLHVENSARKRSSKFQLSIDNAFDQVVNMVVVQHGQNWLCDLIQKSFREIYQNPSKFRSKIHSIEIWQDDKLVAGELGYCCGPIYTSLTGAFIQAGAGTVQLITLGRLLEQAGFQIWDFGMSMPYKVNLGGKTVERQEWLDLYASLRDIPTPELKIDEKVSARFIVDFNHIITEPEKKTQIRYT